VNIPKGGGQLTLVAFYGSKAQEHPKLWAAIQEAQQRVTAHLGKQRFVAYDEHRVHGTVVGLEGSRVGDCVLNENFCKKLGRFRQMQLHNLVQFLRADKQLFPIPLKLGGYDYAKPFPFTSRNQHPYFRSFSIQGENVVAMAWPYQKEQYPSVIDQLRRKCNEFGILHKYHDTSDAVDNDFFFVLGNMTDTPDGESLRACQHDIREFLASLSTPDIVLTENELKILAYPKGDTKFLRAEAFSLKEAEGRIPELLEVYPTIE
jgi:hypothetical protein